MTPKRSTTGFLASEDDPIDMSSSPVYRCKSTAKAAKRMVKGETWLVLLALPAAVVGVLVPDDRDDPEVGALMAMLACKRASEVCSVS